MKLGRANPWFALAALWFGAGVYALFFKENSSLAVFPHFDKVSHCALFFVQLWLLAKGFFSRQRPIPWRALLMAAMVWAAASEIMQGLLTAKREADVWDAAADVLGAVLALWLAQGVARARQGKRVKKTG